VLLLAGAELPLDAFPLLLFAGAFVAGLAVAVP